jgi:hypothetical protein
MNYEPESLEEVICRPADAGEPTASPIFILGIAARSGTNYLHDLIRMHPDCDSGSAVLEEDNLVSNAHLLAKYVDGVSRWWKHHWSPEELQWERDLLMQQLGQGLIAFLSSQLKRRKQISGRDGTNGHSLRLVTKTPTVRNLGLFFRLFPSSQLLVLVRDGRSVVESSVRTFDRPYGHAAKEWAHSARIIQDHCKDHPQKQFLLVRYEDLYSNPESELRRIFDYLHLDADAYDYVAAANLPVRGSSTLRGQASSHSAPWVANGIHWEPVEKPKNFNPMERWTNWNRAKHERFNWLAGECLVPFGYAKKTYRGGHAAWAAWNFVLDIFRVDEAVWLATRIRRKWQAITSIEDFLAFLRLIKRAIIDALWERTEFGI